MNDDGPSDTDTESPSYNGHLRSGEGDISISEVHRLLASTRRRILLSYLGTRPEMSVDVDELVEAVAAEEQPDPGPTTHLTRVEIDLHHVQLPTLADAGVVEYDPVAQTVQYDGAETLESVLATDTGESIDG